MEMGFALAKRILEATAIETSREHPDAAPNYTLSHGYAGLALLWEQADRCFPGEKFELVAREHLQQAREILSARKQQPLGLFGGLAGYAYAAHYLSRGRTRYRRAQDEIDAVLHAAISRRCQTLNFQEQFRCSDWDLISGLTGVGAYLLDRRSEPDAGRALDGVVKFLVDLFDDSTPPRWFTPGQLTEGESMRRAFPEGSLNCGLAHGAPGPLALLSLAFECGLSLPGLPAAIDRTASWLVKNRCDDEWGPNWPSAWGPASGGTEPAPRVARAAWCYGSPGIARALWLAGRALPRREFQDLAQEALAAVFRRPSATLKLDSPMFCHGESGVLQITWRFAHETRETTFLNGAASLTESILARFEIMATSSPAQTVTAPWLLEGMSGISLALLADGAAPPDWDRAFLLS